MSVLTKDDGSAVMDQAQEWLDALESALRNGSGPDFEELFLEDSYWRDMFCLTWDTCQFWTRDAIRDTMLSRAGPAGIADFRLDEARSAHVRVDFIGQPVMEVFFVFDTAVGAAKGFARLAIDPSSAIGVRALMMGTALVALNCAPEQAGRHPRLGFDPDPPGQTWKDWVAAKSDLSARDPDVLIVGGSQSGLSVGARFERKGISYLIVDKSANPGDNWRNRYDALALHTPTPMNHLPYIPLPDNWPMFLSKDQWADWLDCYSKLMNLNWWGRTEALGASFDLTTRTWEVRLRLPDGNERIMRPKHLVLAVGGVGSTPRIPDLPGMSDFDGDVTHSSSYKQSDVYKGKRVMVVGSSTTAHDICLDLHHKGALPTMAQRGPACVVNISEVLMFAGDYNRIPADEADQMRSAMSLPLMIKRAQFATRMSEKSHAELHSGLRKAGQKLTIGDDETGWSMKLFRDLAGYYLNVGASEAIVEGNIKMLDFDRIDRMVPDGVRLDDGTVEAFDSVVLATGYNDVSDTISALLGADVAAKVGRCIGVAGDGEYRSMSRPVAQPHLWLINGGIVDSRKASDLLALQVIAQLNGLVPSLVRRPDGTVEPL